jgi:hypothetical protein
MAKNRNGLLLAAGAAAALFMLRKSGDDAPDVIAPGLTAHILGPGEDGSAGMVAFVIPVEEDVDPLPTDLGQYYRNASGQLFTKSADGKYVPAQPPPRSSMPVRPSGAVRVAPSPTTTQQVTTYTMQGAAVIGAATLVAPVLKESWDALANGHPWKMPIGKAATLTGAAAVTALAAFGPPSVAGGGEIAIAVTDTVLRAFNGNLTAASIATNVTKGLRGGAKVFSFAVPALGAVVAAGELVDAFIQGTDHPDFARNVTRALVTGAGALVGLVNPIAGAAVTLAGRKLVDVAFNWWSERQAKALAHVTGESVDQQLAEYEAWYQAQPDIQAAQARSDWWDIPQAAPVDDVTAWQLPEAPYDPTLIGEAGAELSTEIVPAEIPAEELTLDELAALAELTDEELAILKGEEPVWEGGFGVSQPVDQPVTFEEAAAPEPTYSELVEMSMAPFQVKLLGAWDSLIHTYTGPDAVTQCAAFTAQGGAKCRAEYRNGSTIDFSGNDPVSMEYVVGASFTAG